MYGIFPAKIPKIFTTQIVKIVPRDDMVAAERLAAIVPPLDTRC